MSLRKTPNTRMCLLLGLMSTSSTIIAEPRNPLVQFSTQDRQASLTNSQIDKSCHDTLDENNIEPLCESNADDTNIFDNKPILSISTQIDIRPASCLSFFDDYLHTRRGLRIESALRSAPLFTSTEATVATFPVIDFIDNGHAHIVKSKDLASNIYSNGSSASPLFESIIADAKDINERILEPVSQQQTITAKSNGETTSLRFNDITDISLHIVIQSGLATENQIAQIRQVEKELKKRWGIELKIIEIP